MAKKNIIGERVQKLRKLHQYTLDDLGKYCGCKRQRIYQIESGQSCVKCYTNVVTVVANKI